MNLGKVDYRVAVTPPSYKCAHCGATGLKLWREYVFTLEQIELTCAPCSATAEKKNLTDIDTYLKTTDQIGGRIPAVPTEDGTTFWGYTSVSQAGCAWWKALPTT